MANSSRVTAPRMPAPTTSIEITGRMATIDVLTERISTWFIESELSSV